MELQYLTIFNQNVLFALAKERTYLISAFKLTEIERKLNKILLNTTQHRYYTYSDCSFCIFIAYKKKTNEYESNFTKNILGMLRFD